MEERRFTSIVNVLLFVSIKRKKCHPTGRNSIRSKYYEPYLSAQTRNIKSQNF